MNKIAISLLLITLFSCGEKKKSEENVAIEAAAFSLEDQIVGTWTNTALNVRMKGVIGDSILDVPEGQWENVLKIKPIITTIRKDGSFTSEYYTLEDELMMTSEGTWYIKNDSLVLVQDNVATAYLTTIKNDIATFKGYLDWDQDGQSDDYYEGTQRKMRNQ